MSSPYYIPTDPPSSGIEKCKKHLQKRIEKCIFAIG